MNKNKRKNYLIKLWCASVFIITCIYFLILNILKSNSINSSHLNEMNRLYLKSITPAYPPPLFNFGDSPNVLKINY